MVAAEGILRPVPSVNPSHAMKAILALFCLLGAVVTACGRLCYQGRKINLSQVFAGQKVGVRQTDDHVWLVTFMDYDLGYFDDEVGRLEPIDNPFGSSLLPMSPE